MQISRLPLLLLPALISFAQAETQIPNDLIQAARSEGTVNSLGMPDTWANWKDTWQDLQRLYGIQHTDTDMSSAQEVAKFEAEKSNASGDIGDVGAAFGPIAVQKGVTQAYKPTTWEQIPTWAKDSDGHWMLSYTGTIAFIVNKQAVKNIPRSWADLKQGDYKIAIGDVSAAAQASNGVLSAAMALGGDEKNIDPALHYFADLAKQGRLLFANPTIQTLEKGEVVVGIVWDFNGLGYRQQIDPDRFEVLIPSDGSVTSGYTTLINRYAKHPNAAKLAREYILSDAGQINLAKGHARPIRIEHLQLPAQVQADLLPQAQYAKARPILDAQAWEATAKSLPQRWQEEVLINMP